MKSIVQTKKDLLNRLHRQKAELRKLGVVRIGVFGSFQREEQSPESDVDLLVDFAAGKKSFDSYMTLSFLLEEALSRPVEIVTRQALSQHIGPHILSEIEYVEIRH